MLNVQFNQLTHGLPNVGNAGTFYHFTPEEEEESYAQLFVSFYLFHLGAQAREFLQKWSATIPKMVTHHPKSTRRKCSPDLQFGTYT